MSAALLASMQVFNMFMRGLLAALVCMATACGAVKDDAGRDAGSAVGADAGQSVVPGPPSTELTAGSARISGKRYTMAVQVGHAFQQAPVRGASHTTTGGAVVNQ